MKEPLVSIVLLNWNSWRDTVECVESCMKLTYPNLGIVLVDNGSTDGSEEYLRERYPDLDFIQTGANLGFAGGNNIGIQHALEKGADYVWLLNNDTVVAPDALGALVSVAEGDDKIGMVGSKIYFYDNPRLLWYAGAEINPLKPHRMHHIGLREEDKGQYDTQYEPDFVTGCSILAKKQMIRTVGVMDDSYFLYFEDSDWGFKAKRAGWKLVYCPLSLVYHKESLSIGGADSPLMRYYCSRNFLYFIKRNLPNKFISSFLYVLFEYVIVNIKKRKFASAIMALRGIYHYFRGHTGPLQKEV
jgi:GT2 family glycosyltransferase